MKKRKLGWTGLELSNIGLGTWAMGGENWQFSWGPQEDRESIATIHKALDLGINWIDTAAVYGLGHSEEVVGKAIKGMRNRPLIATKCVRIWDEKRMIGTSHKKESIRSEIEISLKRLQLDTIDLYQMHWPAGTYEETEEAWDTLAALVREGKIRYAGVCNFNSEQLRRVHAIHPVASLQPPYNMLRRDIESDQLPFCGENNIGVVVYSPMQKGLLTGKLTRERIQGLPPNDHRRKDPGLQEPELSANMELVEHLDAIAKKRGKTAAQLALAWTLRRPEVTAAIVGARKPSQIEETAPAGEWELSEEDSSEIDILLEKRKRALGIK